MIDVEQMKTLQSMIGFRNILVHEYQRIDLHILVNVIEHRMQELLDFANVALKAVD